MLYRSVKTGRIIDIPAVLTSPDWVKVGTETPAAKKEKAVKPDGGKKTVRTGK